jgi:hypothetical protein
VEMNHYYGAMDIAKRWARLRFSMLLQASSSAASAPMDSSTG